MEFPSVAQQKGLAFAPLPFAVLSFFSSGYVICHLLFQQRQKLERLYHRLVLAMNFALLGKSVVELWSPFAVPEGTPYHFGASGTIQTCTAQAFLYLVFQMTIPTYYGSLSLQAFMGVKHNYNEEKYKWIEKYVHIFAWSFPIAFSTIFAATENFNPSASGCFIANAPLGCDIDPDVPCQRGHHMQTLELIVGLGFIFLCLVFPPSVIMAMCCWIRKVRKKMDMSTGMQKLRASARKEAVKNIASQISLYLFCFWFTWVFGLIHAAYFFLTHKMMYDLLIFSICLDAMQGLVYAVVYFSLQVLGTPKVQVVCVQSNFLQKPGLTVEDIRVNAENKAKNGPGTTLDERETFVFNIFDGVADADSPWAKFINEDDYTENPGPDDSGAFHQDDIGQP